MMDVYTEIGVQIKCLPAFHVLFFDFICRMQIVILFAVHCNILCIVFIIYNSFIN